MEAEGNAYAVTQDDRDYVDTVQHSSDGCLAVLFCFSVLTFVFLIIAWVGTVTYRSANPTKPMFKYGDVVEVVDGFYQGCRGEVTDGMFSATPGDPLGHWEYLLEFDAGVEFVEESQLRKVGDDELIGVRDADGRLRYGRVVEAQELFDRMEQK